MVGNWQIEENSSYKIGQPNKFGLPFLKLIATQEMAQQKPLKSFLSELDWVGFMEFVNDQN